MFTWKNSGKRLKRRADIIVKQSEFRIIEQEIVETVGGGATARIRTTQTELIYTKRGARRLADVVSDFRATTGEGPVPIERVPHHAGVSDTRTPKTGAPDTGAPNTGTPNTGAPDTGAPDTGAPNNGAPHPGAPNAGTPNTGAPDTGIPAEGPSELDTGYFADNEGSQESPIRSTQPDQQRIYEEKQAQQKAAHRHAKKLKHIHQKEGSTKKSITKNEERVQQKAQEESTATEDTTKAQTEDDARRLREKAGKASAEKTQVQQENTELRTDEGMLDEARTDLKQEGEQLSAERGALNEAQESLDTGDVEKSKAKLEVAQDHGKRAARYADASTQIVEKVDSRQQSRRPSIAESPSDVDKGPTDADELKKQEDEARRKQDEEARKKQDNEARKKQDDEPRKKQDDESRKKQVDAQRTAQEEAERNKSKPSDHPEGPAPSAEELAKAHHAVSRDAQLPHEIKGMQNMIAADAANAEAARARIPDLERQAAEL
ncbi:hypothetical protein B0A48_17902 [Cryoendolithus antarcticus]|uniref:Uncharacterized protein n=1 Tax=Cryoendolithus antarcticus TaxID=1507870 RepID=A0A1V8SA90_9PEZI|nr:hypothetical protein B0A48_17902 [Cryoendolithus antarcticus]